MSVIKKTFEEIGYETISIGHQNENLASRVEIDVGSVLAQYPGAHIWLAVRTPSGAEYPAATQLDGQTLVWDVLESDLTQDGIAGMQVVIDGENGEIVRSDIALLRVHKSIVGEGPAPEPVKGWMDDANKTLDELKDIVAGGGGIVGGSNINDTVTSSNTTWSSEKIQNEIEAKPGTPGEKGDPFTYEDFTPEQLAELRGEPGVDGQNGAPGKDGVTPTIGENGNWYLGGEDTGKPSRGEQGVAGSNGISATHTWNGTTLTVTSASGTSSANLKGEKGDNGSEGPAGANGKTPVKGTDYFTESDKAEMAQSVLDQLTGEMWTFTLEDGTTVTKQVVVKP